MVQEVAHIHTQQTNIYHQIKEKSLGLRLVDFGINFLNREPFNIVIQAIRFHFKMLNHKNT